MVVPTWSFQNSEPWFSFMAASGIVTRDAGTPQPRPPDRTSGSGNSPAMWRVTSVFWTSWPEPGGVLPPYGSVHLGDQSKLSLQRAKSVSGCSRRYDYWNSAAKTSLAARRARDDLGGSVDIGHRSQCTREYFSPSIPPSPQGSRSIGDSFGTELEAKTDKVVLCPT